jgi:hypothetical protein
MNSTLVQPDNSNCEPFSGDKLNRKEYGEKLIHLFKELPKGVIAIDGEWGNGKADTSSQSQAIDQIWKRVKVFIAKNLK